MPSAKELREIAKDLGLRGYSKMNKTQLTESIEGHVKTSKDLVEKSTPKEETTPTAPVKQKRKSNSPWVSFCRSSKKEPESLPPVEESE